MLRSPSEISVVRTVIVKTCKEGRYAGRFRFFTSVRAFSGFKFPGLKVRGDDVQETALEAQRKAYHGPEEDANIP